MRKDFTMAERVHLFTTPNSLHATSNLFHVIIFNKQKWNRRKQERL